MFKNGGIARLAAVITVAGLSACVAPKEAPKPGAIRINENPYPSTYQPYGSVPTLIRGATILDGEGSKIEMSSAMMPMTTSSSTSVNPNPGRWRPT